jgi:hypothetical protein
VAFPTHCRGNDIDNFHEKGIKGLKTKRYDTKK